MDEILDEQNKIQDNNPFLFSEKQRVVVLKFLTRKKKKKKKKGNIKKVKGAG